MNKKELDQSLKQTVNRIDTVLNNKIATLEKKKKGLWEKINIFIICVTFLLTGLSTYYTWQSLHVVTQIESKFKPLILQQQYLELSTPLIEFNGNVYTTKPLYMPTIQKETNSGEIKRQYIAYSTKESTMLQDITKDNIITVDLSNQVYQSYIQFPTKDATALNEKGIGLMINNINDIHTSIIHFILIGYDNTKSNVTGILHTKGNTIKMRLLYGVEVANNEALSDIYNQIDFKTDLIWKTKSIHTFEAFKMYVLNERKQVIHLLNELGE